MDAPYGFFDKPGSLDAAAVRRGGGVTRRATPSGEMRTRRRVSRAAMAEATGTPSRTAAYPAVAGVTYWGRSGTR